MRSRVVESYVIGSSGLLRQSAATAGPLSIGAHEAGGAKATYALLAFFPRARTELRETLSHDTGSPLSWRRLNSPKEPAFELAIVLSKQLIIKLIQCLQCPYCASA